MSQLVGVTVPEKLESKLAIVRQRHSFVRLLACLLKWGSALLAVILMAMLVDYVATLFSPLARLALTISALTLAGLLLYRWVIKPLGTSANTGQLARRVDDAVPELQERWSTVTGLAASQDDATIIGSPELIREVANEAEALEHLVEPQHVVTKRSLRPFCAALGVVSAVTLLGLFFDWSQTMVLFQRFCAPLSPISLTRIATTGDTIVAKNEPFQLEATMSGRPRAAATLILRPQSGPTERVTVVPNDQRKLTHTVSSAQESMEYRIRAGDGQTAWHSVFVAERPRLTKIELHVAPPRYSGLEETQLSTLPRQTRILEGSRLRVALAADQELTHAELEVGNDRVIMTKVEGGYEFETTVEDSFKLTPHLTGAHGLANCSPPTCDVVVYRDTAPIVNVVTPDNELDVTPDDRVDIQFVAKDDLGITRAELVVYGDDGLEETDVIPIPLGKQRGQKEIQGATKLQLARYQLKHGEQLSYAVRVFDAKDASGQSNSSGQNSGNQVAKKSTSSKNQRAQSSKTDQQVRSDERNKDNAPSIASNKNDSSSTAKQAKSAELQGAPRPTDNMTRRKLDVAGQCGTSARGQIRIDEWASSFATQAQKKLQLAIDPRLKELDKELAQAEQLTAKTIIHLKDQPWKAVQGAAIDTATKHLDQGTKVARDLFDLSQGTPYAFIGLQLTEIVHSHVEPATTELQQTLEVAENQLEHLRPALHHIRRARQRIASLVKTYETMKLNQQLAESVQRIKKMHQLFLENTFTMLGSKKPILNPKQRKMLELDYDEEFLKKLQELLEKKRDIQAELAKMLAKDPRLQRRFMARTRLEATTLRDQMTLLARRQETLSKETTSWCELEGKEFVDVARTHIANRQNKLVAEIAADAAKLDDNFTTWIPLDLDPKRDDLASMSRQIGEISMRAGELAANEELISADTLENARQLYQNMLKLDEQLPKLSEERHAKLAVHAANRLAENRELITLTTGWLKRAESLRDGKFHLAAEIDQHRLTTDTAELARKLDNLQSWFAAMPKEVQQAGEELNELLDQQLLVKQTAAIGLLAKNQIAGAAQRQAEARELFAKAEELFDLAIDEAIKFMDSQQASAKPGLPSGKAPTLESMLAMLEDEAKACESLGIPCRPTNLMIQKDWMTGKPCGSCSNPGMAGAVAQTQAGQEDVSKLGTKLESYFSRIEEFIADSESRSFPRSGNTLRWNKVRAQLEDRLRQSHRSSTPEQYRQAIEQYFEVIASQQ